MDTQEKKIRRLVERIARGRITVEEAVDQIFYEMSRGGVLLLVDHNCRDLGVELADIGYTVYRVAPKASDEQIKKQARGHILVTRNGEHFERLAHRKRYDYGLVWVLPPFDAKLAAKRVEKVLTTHNFNRRPNQMVKV